MGIGTARIGKMSRKYGIVLKMTGRQVASALGLPDGTEILYIRRDDTWDDLDEEKVAWVDVPIAEIKGR